MDGGIVSRFDVGKGSAIVSLLISMKSVSIRNEHRCANSEEQRGREL